MATVALIAERGQPKYTELGDRIARLRDARGLSQREFALRIEKSDGYPAQVEGGWIRPRPETLRRIARALAADYDELAELADYATRQHGEATMRVPAEDLPDARWWLSLSPIVRRALRAAGDALRSDIERADLQLGRAGSEVRPSGQQSERDARTER